jgi:hypothetical protein
MTIPLRYTVLTDGSSDLLLLSPLRWLIAQHTKTQFVLTWAELRNLPNPPKRLGEKIRTAIRLYPCDVLFIHRDAETATHNDRISEIDAALLKANLSDIGVVHVVPVRMQEAWFLFHETALRFASDNPNGNKELNLPPLKKIETIPDPKAKLHELLCEASGLRGRHLKKFNRDLSQRVHRLSTLIDDYSPLRQLAAFNALESEIKKIILHSNP